MKKKDYSQEGIRQRIIERFNKPPAKNSIIDKLKQVAAKRK